MFASCADPSSLEGLSWLLCYLTSGKHILFYISIGTVLLLLAITAPVALAFGFGGAMAARSHFLPLRWFGKAYTSMVRGIPDIIFFLFVPIALDQLFEFIRLKIKCPDWDQPVWQGSDFVVCPAAKLPLSTSPQWVHETYGFFMAVLAFAIVFGAFAANVIYGAMNAVPRAQMETAEAYGMSHRQAFRRICGRPGPTTACSPRRSSPSPPKARSSITRSRCPQAERALRGGSTATRTRPGGSASRFQTRSLLPVVVTLIALTPTPARPCATHR